MAGDIEERISVRAYRIWEEKGRPHGSAEDHWLQAKREIEEEDRAAGKTGMPQPKSARPRKAPENPPADTGTTTPVKRAATRRKGTTKKTV